MQGQPSLITFSHLRWDFVYQRPQHLMSRWARQHRVIFIEEPVFDSQCEPYWERQNPLPNLLVLRPHTPIASPGFHAAQIPILCELVRDFLAQEKIEEYVCWFYTPMAFPLIEDLRPLAVVYDCMDELSAFLNAPPELLRSEEHLLKMADLVFTGGPSLYRAKKDRHPDVHCFPSSVDAAHFGANNGAEEARDQLSLKHPRLGFYGVIDERMDLELLGRLAEARPDWQIVMVGPVVKISPDALPRQANIHYFGQRSYEQLPSYLRGWDVCLLPFARNKATQFISPTKTLEYMAAEKMIVSTPITDVAEPYRELVYLGSTPEQFVQACDKALSVSGEERAARLNGMRQVLSGTSWDVTVESMQDLVTRVIERRTPQAEGRSAVIAGTSDKPYGTVVIGAGPTGLSAAYHLPEDTLLLEQNSTVGGWCRSIRENGFTFDYAGHIMFSNDPYVHQLYNMLLGDNVHWQDREAWIWSKNVYTRYPFQGALYGLPPQVIKECIVGAIEARFGSAAGPKEGAAGVNGHANGKNGKAVKSAATYCGDVKDCCADGILESSAPLVEPSTIPSRSSEPRNFEEFIYKIWGAGIAKHFAIPYNRKLWAVPLHEMETSWLGGRVPLPDLEEMIEGALSPVGKPMGPNARFGYPLRGGFQALMDGWLPFLKNKLRRNSRVARVSPLEHKVTLSDGVEIGYDHLISTMPPLRIPSA